MSDIIEIKHLSKKFGEKQVINGININVRKQEIFGLLGPSGAGKTTIIKILTGQLLCTSGSAKVFNTETKKLSDLEYSQIGMVMDNSGVYSRLTCYDNLLMFAQIYNIDKHYIREVLERVQLIDAIKKPVGKMSKGMLQRLIMARAILHKPKLLFLDEPTSGLDPATTENIHELIFNLRREGTTVFLTTHNMEEAAKMCDNIALLNEGHIIELGSPENICRKYNKENKIIIVCKDNSIVSFSNNSLNADKIAQYFKDDNVLSIHSSEPNLESVFIALTGRKLV